MRDDLKSFKKKLDAQVEVRQTKRLHDAEVKNRGQNNGFDSGNDDDDLEEMDAEAAKIHDINEECLQLIKQNEQRIHQRVIQQFTANLVLNHLERYLKPRIRARMEYFKKFEMANN